ncbi:Lrp/AsnC family transcriptional regulator [Bacteroidota bacterium]
MDLTDQKILAELDKNTRIPLKQIAKKIHASQQMIDYRIKNLIKKEIIYSFATIINPFSLGYNLYITNFSFEENISEDKDNLLTYLRDNHQVFWAAIIGGTFDLMIITATKNFSEQEDFLDKLFKRFPNKFSDYEIFPIIEINHYSHKFFGATDFSKYTITEVEPVTISATDYKILEELKNDSRQSMLSVGQKIGVDYHTVKNRIEKMTKKGVIMGYRMFLNPEKLKMNSYHVFLSLRKYSKSDEKMFLAYVAAHTNVVKSLKLIGGRWAYNLSVEIESREKLQELLISLRKLFPIIDDINTCPVFHNIEIDYLPISKKITKEKN